jgi:hypothetical protein
MKQKALAAPLFGEFHLSARRHSQGILAEYEAQREHNKWKSNGVSDAEMIVAVC